MNSLAHELAEIGLILRSGGADGADTAFELYAGDKKEIYIPWKNFNNRKGILVDFERNYNIAKRVRPDIANYKSSVKKLYARNISQILGRANDEITKFVVCWTPEGKDVGGTGFAIEVARCYGVKIFNYGAYEDPEDLRKDVLEFIIKTLENEENESYK